MPECANLFALRALRGYLKIRKGCSEPARSPVCAEWVKHFHTNHMPFKSPLTNIPQTHNASLPQQTLCR